MPPVTISRPDPEWSPPEPVPATDLPGYVDLTEGAEEAEYRGEPGAMPEPVGTDLLGHFGALLRGIRRGAFVAPAPTGHVRGFTSRQQRRRRRRGGKRR